MSENSGNAAKPANTNSGNAAKPANTNAGNSGNSSVSELQTSVSALKNSIEKGDCDDIRKHIQELLEKAQPVQNRITTGDLLESDESLGKLKAEIRLATKSVETKCKTKKNNANAAKNNAKNNTNMAKNNAKNNNNASVNNPTNVSTEETNTINPPSPANTSVTTNTQNSPGNVTGNAKNNAKNNANAQKGGKQKKTRKAKSRRV
jgi:hypothetical protein